MKIVFFSNYGYNFGTDDPRDLNFFLKTENEKILDTCLGVIQTLDQWPGGALEIVFFYMAITLERRDLKFVL